jgi:hypothetical protein
MNMEKKTSLQAQLKNQREIAGKYEDRYFNQAARITTLETENECMAKSLTAAGIYSDNQSKNIAELEAAIAKRDNWLSPETVQEHYIPLPEIVGYENRIKELEAKLLKARIGKDHPVVGDTTPWAEHLEERKP